MHGKAFLDNSHRKGRIRKDFRSAPGRRYHSLFADRATFPSCLDVTAESDDGVIMAVRHKDLPVEAVQFHPNPSSRPNRIAESA